ncbi:MAG: hypothetical protein KC486_33720 [Myxococcales bacterium]|nr:hypothetical protein [Myxococcales bacterium]
MSQPSKPPQKAADAFTESLEVALRDPVSLELRDDLDDFVPAIPPQSFYRLARALHEEGRLDLLFPHANPAQLTTVLDLGAWQGERLDVLRVREWITAIVHTYEDARAPRGALARLIRDMDPEIWTFALLPGSSVYELDPEDDEARDRARGAVDGLYTYDTPDGGFLLAVPDDPIGRAAVRILDAVYHDDLQLGRELTVSIAGGLYSVIEEDLLRWRNGRLADLGFVPWEEAMRLLRPLSPEQALRREAQPKPGFGAGLEQEPTPVPAEAGLLRRVLARLDAGEAGLRTREFLLLTNEVIAAQRLPPGEPASAERALLQTRGTLDLGLELLATARPEDQDLDAFLADATARIGLRDVFRVGYGALAKLRAAALALHRSGQVSIETIGSLLDRPWGPTLRALAQPLPELPLEETSGKTRPLSSLRDVAKATQRIAEATLLAGLAFAEEGFALDPVWVQRADDPSRLTLGDLIRSALVHRRLPGASAEFAPLKADDLDWGARELLDGTRALLPGLRADLETRARALGATAAATAVVLDGLLTRLQVELAGLERDDDGAPDLTRVGGLLTIQRVGVWLRTGLTQA